MYETNHSTITKSTLKNNLRLDLSKNYIYQTFKQPKKFSNFKCNNILCLLKYK